MANPAPTINQINAFNATQGTTIDFNIIGGTELVRSNRIYIYDLSDNSLICTHLYVSTESIHELPPNTDGSIVYESGKSSADFVNGAQYYAQIQTFTDIAGTEGGSGLSVAKMFWCLVDPTLTITTIPSTISTTSYNVSATYNANTSVVSNIIQQYQFSLYSATGSLLQSSGVVVGSGTQQGTSTTYDISYNFTGLSVGSSYYVVVDVTTTQGMSVSTQSSTFTVSIDTPTLGEATVVNNACDGYISVTSNLSGEYGGSGSGEIVSFETDSENVFTKLQVDLESAQEGTPWVSASDTEPYLMRISPQFDHDYNTEFDTLVGGTVAWNQLVNISNGTTTSYGVTFTFSENKVSYSGTSSSPYSYIDLFSGASIANGLIVGHKYLIAPTDDLFVVVNNPYTDTNSKVGAGKACIYTPTAQPTYFYGRIKVANGSSVSATNASINLFDLTQMFGTAIADYIYSLEQANTGAGVAWFRKYFSKPYYAYDAGTLMSVKTSAHKTTGKNLLPNNVTSQTINGITITVSSDGVITCNGTATAQVSAIIGSVAVKEGVNYKYNGMPSGSSTSTYFLNLQPTPQTGVSDTNYYSEGQFTPISDLTINARLYIRNGQTVNNLVFKPMIRMSSITDNTYEPYDGNTYPLDPNLELRGIPKLVNNKLQYDGDVYSSSGNVQRRFRIVDLGTLNWVYFTGKKGFYANPGGAKGVDQTSYESGVCSKYSPHQYGRVVNGEVDKTFYIANSTHLLYIYDSAYESLTAEQFKTAMSGVYLVYELATPTTETAMPFEANQSIVPNGSEEYIDSRTVPIPVGHLTSYADVFPITGHDEVDVSVVGKNLIPDSTHTGDGFVIDSYINGTNGQVVGGDYDSYVTEYFKVLPSTEYTISSSTGSITYNLGGICFYDSSKTFISGISFSRQSVITFTTPSNAKYARCCNPDQNTTLFQLQMEKGSSATTYEPYNPNSESYTQDIEVTYTPTVQENEAYLFKQTEDVGGDRETIELVGGTVAWNQLVQNGDFANTNNWTPASGTLTASSNIGKFTAGATGYFHGIYQNISVASGHKLLFCCDYKITTANSNVTRWRMVLSNGGNGDTVWFSKVDGWGKANAIVTATNSWGQLYLITEYNKTLSQNDTFEYKNVQLIDLTQMFGTTIADYIYSLEQANTGDGVAFFRKLFPKAYYPYNAGELISVKTSAHKTVGFNQWDEEWETGGINVNGTNNNESRIRSKNYIPVMPNTTYYVWTNESVSYDPTIMVLAFDANKTVISNLGWKGGTVPTFTTPDNCYFIRFQGTLTRGTTLGSNICINLSKTTGTPKNGDYVVYEGHSYPLDSDLELRGMLKLDISNKLYYDGDTYASDGAVTRKYGIVDLGTLTWYRTATTTSGKYRFYSSTIPNIKNASSATAIGNIVCEKYLAVSNTNTYNCVQGIAVHQSQGNIYIYDETYSTDTDAPAFKTAMSGVYLVYELATPTTETADAFEEIQKVTPIYGTEEFVDNRAVPIPVGNNTQYLTRDIYGGYIDLVSGVLVLDKKCINLGTISWDKFTNATKTYFRTSNEISDMAKSTGNNIIQPINCSHYMTETWTHTLDTVGYNGCVCEGYKDKSYIAIYDEAYVSSTSNDFKSAMDGVQLVYPLAEPMIFQLTPQQIQTLVGKNNVWSEQGDIEVAYNIPITNLLVKRQDVADVSGDWLTLYSQPITQASDMDFTFIDFTNQYGKTYKYALVPLLTQTQSGVEVEVEGGYTVSDEVQSIFDGVFIVDSTGSQKCKANVGYGNVDMNQAVGTITPIGAKYPVVITNSKNQYHNGSIYGTIVPDDYYFNGNLSRIDMVNKRDELEQFLTNKRAKIIKDWNGKIWLVMIMDNVSCTFNNNYGMGIVNFSTNWVEVGDPTNQQDLQATGLINVGGA